MSILKYHLMKNRSWSILVVILFAIVGFLVAYVLISAHYRHPEKGRVVYVMRNLNDNRLQEVSPDTLSQAERQLLQKPVEIKKNELLFTLNPDFLIWVALILIMFSIASAALPVFITQIMNLKKKFHINRLHILFSFLFAVAVIGILAALPLTLKSLYYPSKLIDDFGILLTSGDVVRRIAVVTTILQIPIAMVIYLVGRSAGSIRFNIKDKKSVEKAVKQFTFLNQALIGALQILAVLVVFSVLTTGVLEQAIKSVLSIKGFYIFPNKICYVYGMFFSLFLGIIYIPTYIFLRYSFNKMTEDSQSEVEAEDEETQKSYQDLLATVNFKDSALDNLKLALTVMAPLISSFLPEGLRFFH